jgi:GAF domain-containing protein
MQEIEQLQVENKKLRRAVEELATLNDLARAISALRNSQDIMNTIIRRSLRAVSAEQGIITLVEKNEADPMKTLVRDMSSSAQHQPFHLHQNLMGWMQLNKKNLMINDPHSDDRFRGIKWEDSIHSLLCVPLMVKSELIGILTVCNKKMELKFSDEDQRVLSIIAGQSAQVVENARLYEEEQALLRMQECRKRFDWHQKFKLTFCQKNSPRFLVMMSQVKVLQHKWSVATILILFKSMKTAWQFV